MTCSVNLMIFNPAIHLRFRGNTWIDVHCFRCLSFLGWKLVRCSFTKRNYSGLLFIKSHKLHSNSGWPSKRSNTSFPSGRSFALFVSS